MKRPVKNPILIILLFIALIWLSYIFNGLILNVLMKTGLIVNPFDPLLGLFFLVPQALMIYVLVRVFMKKPNAYLWMDDPKILQNIPKGFVSGFILYSSFMLIALLFKGYRYEGVNDISILRFLLFIPAFFGQSFAEEILVRGLMQRVVYERFGFVAGVIGPSLFFALMHFRNAGLNALSFINLIFAGVLFAVMVFATGSLWFASAAHGAWNFFQGIFYGQAVSGANFQESLLNFEPLNDSPWLIGGTFGPEGSLTTTVVLILGILVFLYWRKRNELKVVEHHPSP